MLLSLSMQVVRRARAMPTRPVWRRTHIAWLAVSTGYNRLVARWHVGKTAKIDTVTFAGRSGEEYELRVYVWDTKFKALPGVYVVASRAMEPGSPATYQPLFV